MIIELDAKTGKLDAQLRKANERLDDIEGSAKKADKSLAEMAKTAVGGAVKIATAAAAAATAIAGIVLASAKSIKELELLARQAGLTVNEFKSLAFATKQFGVDGEKMADISKDISDRLGEYSTVATGVFQDFADVVGMSKTEAQELAKEFQNLSGDQVLGQMVSMMEDAGATGSQMTFVMESMGNDASRLIPLFANQSAELKKLRDGYDQINGSMQLTKEQQEALTQTAQDWDNLTGAMGNAANVISATLAPELSDFINDVIEVVPTATQAIVDFINSFRSAENINSISALDRQIADLNKELEELPEKAKKASSGGSGLFNSMEIAAARGVDATENVKGEIQARIDELVARKKELEDAQQKLDDAVKRQGGQIGGGGTGENVYDPSGPSETGGASSTVQTEGELMAQSFALRAEMLTEAGASEFEILMSNKQRELDMLEDYNKRKLISDEQYAKAKGDLDTFYNNQQVKAGKAAFETALSSGAQNSRKLFELNKIYTASQAALKIPEAVQNSYAWGTSFGGPVAGAAAGAVALSAGLLQLQAINSQSFGGGSSASSVGGGSVSLPTETQQQTQTSSVSIQDVATGNQQTMRVELGIEGLDTLVEGIVKKTKQMEINGELT